MEKGIETNEAIEKILQFMADEIKKTKIPYVSWKTIKKHAEEIIGKTRKPVSKIWQIMESTTYTLYKKEKSPKAKNPKIYEYKIGNTYIYYPSKMIDVYIKSDIT